MRIGAMVTLVPIAARFVVAVTAPRTTIGSRYGESNGHVGRPSAANGYRDVVSTGNTTWSLTQIIYYPVWNMTYHEGQINYIWSLIEGTFLTERSR